MDAINAVKIDKIQQQDNEIVRQYLKDKEDVFVAIRSLLLGQEINKEYKDLIKELFKDAHLLGAFKRSISPSFKDASGLARLHDKWSQLVDTERIIGAEPSTIRQIVTSSKSLIGMCDQALELLVNPDGTKIAIDFDFEESLEKDPFAIQIIARNSFIHHINSKLNQLRIIADTTQKDLDNYLAGLKKNSSK